MKKLLLVFTFLLISLNSELHSAEVGNWEKSFYVDDFGDKTNNGFISQTVKGKFSNSATQNSRLRVKMYINNANLNLKENIPWFRLYEYDGTNPIKGVFYSRYGMSCRIKNQDNIISTLPITQYQGEDYFVLSGKNKMFKELIINEGTASFVCIDDNSSTSKYMFKFDFKGYNNMLKQFSE